MLLKTSIVAFFTAALVAAQSDSEVIAIFILGRHGDRTAKVGPGVEGTAVLTTLGADELAESAAFFRNYYLNSSSQNAIVNASSSFKFGQIYASAPQDPP